MGKMNKKYLSEEQIKEIVNRHSFFQEEDWEISYRTNTLNKRNNRKSDDWSKLKSHTPSVK
jgi:hypothetical protein